MSYSINPILQFFLLSFPGHKTAKHELHGGRGYERNWKPYYLALKKKKLKRFFFNWTLSNDKTVEDEWQLERVFVAVGILGAPESTIQNLFPKAVSNSGPDVCHRHAVTFVCELYRLNLFWISYRLCFLYLAKSQNGDLFQPRTRRLW